MATKETEIGRKFVEFALLGIVVITGVAILVKMSPDERSNFFNWFRKQAQIERNIEDMSIPEIEQLIKNFENNGKKVWANQTRMILELRKCQQIIQKQLSA